MYFSTKWNISYCSLYMLHPSWVDTVENILSCHSGKPNIAGSECQWEDLTNNNCSLFTHHSSNLQTLRAVGLHGLCSYVVILGILQALTSSLSLKCPFKLMSPMSLWLCSWEKCFPTGVLCRSGLPDQGLGLQRITQFLYLAWREKVAVGRVCRKSLWDSCKSHPYRKR